MGLLRRDTSEVFDPVRGSWLKRKPEEHIRQIWVKRLTVEFDFPLSLLATEKELSSLPHVQHLNKKNIPKRRIDIVAFAKVKGSLWPLLLIECKVGSLTEKHLNQVMSYNMISKAPFVGVANATQFLLGFYDGKQMRFVEGLRSYHDMLGNL